MNKRQVHGDHIGAIMDTDEFIKSHINEIIQRARVFQRVRTNVVAEEQGEVETHVFALLYGEGEIKWISLLAQYSDALHFVSCYPVLKPETKVKAKITGVEEWQNRIEATVTCELDDGMELSFFALDYAWNKQKYGVGLTMYVDLAALAYSAEEAEHGFSFEGQEAVDFLAKIGEKPTYDEEGNIKPVHFSTEQLVAFLNSHKEFPEDYEYQSPVYAVRRCDTLGVEMRSCVIAYRTDPRRYLPVYFRAAKPVAPETGMPLRGVLWLQGKISDNQTDEPQELTFEDEDSHDALDEERTSLGEKGEEFLSEIDRKKENGRFDRFDNLNWKLEILDEIRLDAAYNLDAFEVGDDYGARFRLYVRKAGSTKQYKPDLEKRKERQDRMYMTEKAKREAGPFTDFIVPYDDSMYVSGLLDNKEAEQIPEIWRYLKVPFTPMGIWQAWLLKDVYSVLPNKWHGMYNSRSYIFTNEALNGLLESKKGVLSEEDYGRLLYYRETGEVLPKVEVSGDKAVVT